MCVRESKIERKGERKRKTLKDKFVSVLERVKERERLSKIEKERERARERVCFSSLHWIIFSLKLFVFV